MTPFEPRAPVEGAGLTHEDKASRATQRPSPSDQTDSLMHEPAGE